MNEDSLAFRQTAIDVWRSGVAAVDSSLLVQQAVFFDRSQELLMIAGRPVSVPGIRRIEVVGAGKAGAGMARGLETALRDLPPSIQKSGWINVPADCVSALDWIHLHAARPASVNEPTAEGVTGAREIIRRIQSLGEHDICLVLISGGGSALLCLPAPGVTLEQKLQVTRLLAASGTPIEELNLVRTQLSAIKGGRLAAASGSKHIDTLVISDVLGDPLPSIASGPTVPTELKPRQALEILHRRCGLEAVPPRVIEFLEGLGNTDPELVRRECERREIRNTIIGNNATAVTAAVNRASRIAEIMEDQIFPASGLAAQNGTSVGLLIPGLRQRMSLARSDSVNSEKGFCCWVGGGEATVKLSGIKPIGKGGRNQEFVLAAIAACPDPENWRGVVLLSGGTDGEDGPTDAAGAFADEHVVQNMRTLKLDAQDFLKRNDAYHFFEHTGGLIRTGPTHTNVMDLQVLLIAKPGLSF